MEGIPYVARLMAFGLLEPKVTRLGVDFAGTVASVGKNVTLLKPGDDVFGGKTGAFAEYVCVAPDRIARKPANVTFEQAASVPIAAVTALQAIRDKGEVLPGRRVLINGASGGVGTFAVQIAKSYGAHVTGVCSSRNVDLVRSLGADEIVDYTKSDFTKLGQRYDVILDNVGNRSLSAYRRVLKPNGRYVLIGGGGTSDHRVLGPFVRLIKMLALSPFVSQHMGMMLAELNSKDLAVLGNLMEAGTVTPVIDRRYPLSEAPEAIRYLEQGHARGKVIIIMEPGGDASPVSPEHVASSAKPAPPAVIALALVGTLVGVPVIPLVAALVLNRRFKRRNPGQRPYRWGYFFAVFSFLAGIGLGLMLESGVVAAIACGALYAVLAWLFARRHHGAWIALTILSFNPIVWIINLIYLRKRWAE
jgi:NADPH:quinone reductase-like Zn-dependent oxidoreductase